MANILTCYYKPKPGGFCKRLFMSINALLDNGDEVHYLAVTEFPIQHPNCYYHKFPWPEKYTDNLVFWFVFISLSPIFLIILSFRYRISYCYAFNSTYGFLLQPARILKRIPLTIFLRADVIENHKLKNRSGVILAIENIVEGIAIFHAHIYGVSKTLTDNVIRRHKILQPVKYGTLKNNITHAELINNHTDRKTYSKPLRLSCAGILESRKNQILLLNVVKKIASPDIILYLFGAGPDEHKLKETAKKSGITHQVEFMGWVDSETIWKYTDVLLTPSLHEGAPNIVLEGLAHDIPILASDLPEHREILPESSLLHAQDVTAWSRKITSLIDNTEFALKDIRNSQTPYKNNLIFDWNKAIVKLIKHHS